jgi:nucleoside-diphosphate-sugar epimerase
MTSVVVTGAAGFLGRHFVRHHLAQGHHVFGVDNLSAAGARWVDELPIQQRFEADAGMFFTMAAGRDKGFDIAYHFAAPVGGRVKIEGDPLFNADSLRLDSLFFRWAVKQAKLAVYPSSSAVYGVELQERGSGPLFEEQFHPANLKWYAPDEMYGFTKLAGEVLAWKSAAYGLNALCIRPFSGYGEGQSLEYPVPSICQRALERQDPLTIWGSGMQTRDFVHVDDVVGATLARIEAGVSGYQSMNIGSGHPITFTTIASIAADIVGYTPEIVTDSTKPEGVKSRYAKTEHMRKFYKPTVTLKDGLTRVLEDRDAQNRTA